MFLKEEVRVEPILQEGWAQDDTEWRQTSATYGEKSGKTIPDFHWTSLWYFYGNPREVKHAPFSFAVFFSLFLISTRDQFFLILTSVAMFLLKNLFI